MTAKRLYRRARVYVTCTRCGRGSWYKPAPWLQKLVRASGAEDHRVTGWVECRRPEGCGHDVPVTVGDVRQAG